MAIAPANDPRIAQTGDTMFQGYLDPEQAQDYFSEVEKTSIVQRVARKVPMGPTGIAIPHWTGDVQASWVDEGGMKPLTKGNMTKQTLVPTKIATIFAASAEVVRANPAGYLGTMRTKVATAIAMAFDDAALYGLNAPDAFKGYIAETTKATSLKDVEPGAGSKTNAYQSIGVNGLSLLVNDGKKWTGTLLDDTVEPLLNGSVDLNGRPLFVESTYSNPTSPMREGTILGRQTILSDHVVSTGAPGSRTVGFMGDWNQVIWGQVGGLSFDVTDQATLNFGTAAAPELVSLWQHNMVAVRVEAEFAFLVNDKDAFVKLTDAPLA
ncbi:phage major capsid protein [Nocardia sp. NPDC055002]